MTANPRAIVGNNRPPPFVGEDGWVRIDRAIRAHWLVGFGQSVTPSDPSRGGAYSRCEAFIDLIMECRYEAGTVNNGGRKMVLEPGQLLGAVSWLARRWNWTPMTVRGYLDKLEGDGMIERTKPGVQKSDDGEHNMQSGKQATVITICNFKEYQITSAVKQLAAQQAANKQPTSSQQASNNISKDNKGTKEQEDSPPPPAVAGELDRAAINRASARAAFNQWRELARRCDLAIPRDSSFDTWGKKIATRMYEHAEQPKMLADMMAVWECALANVERSSFLRGQTAAGFRADLKFLCQRESFTKLIEGGYGNGAHSKPGGSGRGDIAAIVGNLADRKITLIGDGDEMAAMKASLTHKSGGKP